ncbi:ATP synthase F1 subunit gamma [Patescibacteria group bacterium]|nr:ATP synthase F1 subunit gamma [Patescibacteria group bacterium]
MAQSTKIIKRRIGSITNTRKITKAMELVAASKMRRAVSSVLGTRPYAQMAWETITAVSRTVQEVTHPLLEQNKDAKKTLLVLYTSDRGLAGPFNTNMIKAAYQAISEIEGEVEIVAVGRRGADALRRKNTEVIANFEGLTNKPRFEDILPIGNLIISRYEAGEYRKVVIAYADFVSALTQRPKIINLLPLGQPEDAPELGDLEERKEDIEVPEAKEYIFEPDAQKVLDRILPRLVETMLYQALLESTASEHGARMMAMRNATEAAGDMLTELKFTYNQIRQASITQEIAEISSGKAAIE